MPLYEFLRLAIEKLESSHHKPSSASAHPPSLTENDLFGQQQQQQTDVFATSPTRLSLLPNTPSICDDATLGHSTIAITGKCGGGVEYIFNDISPGLDLTQEDETFPWLSYAGDNDDDSNMQDYSSANKMFMPQENGRSNCDETAVRNLDSSSLQGGLELSSFKARLHHTSDPSLDVDLHVPTAIHSTQLLAKEPKELFDDGRTKNMRLDTSFVKTKCIVASSSLSSGNSADRIRILPYTKRMPRDNEESECQSDEIRNESVGLKKPSVVEGGSGSKRRRVAQVHNLSERRRRDRINQKMHALQELIPNCNKTDKASMLDEAVEYIKNLKHQVQIMSMGCGLCVPAALMSRPMYHVPVPHLSYMGARMGMSTCFGNTNMGLGSPVYQGPHFFPITGLGYHQTNSVVGSSACFRVPAHKINPQTNFINSTSSQKQARNEVPNHKAA